ncbi:single-stranded-DNA-specific exonuclease RecJ [Candidatus Dojkabacteria bacterium]|uniref:Single-stranded-DNA-specific exonuclease RecJ n=1 Tax=Candidatus Dojkabacteria bacterium TaxID=2099670 RepID=A0A955RJ29_9BACT|nr:single-stranded-DNA-specific exonuclease RecJ [Candidatus Dojkabacteria bacterium]
MRWKILEQAPQKVLDELSEYGEIIAQLLFSRGITTTNQADEFFFKHQVGFHDPYTLKGIEKAATTIIGAIKDNKKIFIYGDYDVDGICATSILFDFLYRKLGAEVIPHVPNRFTEGYGLNEESLTILKDQGAELIITVDCGIRDKELVEQFSNKGLQFIITDHHTIPEDEKGKQIVPDRAESIVHPKLSTSDYPFPEICGTTVAWKLLVVLSEHAKHKQMLDDNFDPDAYLDLVALATVCDLMPLQDENRLIVKRGLDQMRQTVNRGLAGLLDFLEITPAELRTYHLGFVIGPRLNASGRIEHALDGVRLLTTNNEQAIRELVVKLNDLNVYRQQITKQLVEEAEAMVTETELNHKLLFLVGDEWPDGVVGLVASKIVEKYSRPVLIASNDDGVVKGSARSIPPFNVTEAISEFSNLLDRFGGHSQAAGFTFQHSHYDEFKSGLQQYANKLLTEEDLIPEIEVEMELKPEHINFDLINEILLMEPFGYQNKTPIFLFSDVNVVSAKLVGKDSSHLSLSVDVGGLEIRCIGFNKKDLFNIAEQSAKIDMIGNLDINHWNGSQYLQIRIKDIKPHESDKKS